MLQAATAFMHKSRQAQQQAVSHGGLPCWLQGDTVEQLLPLFLTLLKDEWPDVRLAIIGKLQAVNQVGNCSCTWSVDYSLRPQQLPSCTGPAAE